MIASLSIVAPSNLIEAMPPSSSPETVKRARACSFSDTGESEVTEPSDRKLKRIV